MRLAPFVIAACAMSFAAHSSPADDAPRPPETAKPVVLRPEAGKTYLYRLSESIVTRQDIDAGGIVAADLRMEIVWEAGVSLQRVEEDGKVVVCLMPTRV